MLCLVRTKACKRCGGDLSLERDKYGTYIECIQCGAISSETDLTHLSTKVADKRQTLKAIKPVLAVQNR